MALDLGLTDFIERYPDFVFNPSETEKKNTFQLYKILF